MIKSHCTHVDISLKVEIEQIETLEKQLSALLQGGNSVAVAPSAPKAAPKRRVSVPKKAEPASAPPKAAEEGRGTLRPAVVAILKKSKNPLKTADIYDALVAQGRADLVLVRSGAAIGKGVAADVAQSAPG